MKLLKTLSVAVCGLFAASSLACQDAGDAGQGGIPECKDMQTTASGLQWGILKKGGDGKQPVDGDTIVAHYTGWLLSDGSKFDSSRDKGEPLKIGVNQVIKGWTEGLKLMTPGMRCKFIIPADIAYGAQARPGIPANSTLVFDVELLEVISMPKFRPGNPDKQRTIGEGPAEGVKVEVLKPGTGSMCGEGQGIALRYAFWTGDGSRLLGCTERDGSTIGGVIDSLPLPFLKPLVATSKVGEILRCEVPQSVWGNARADTVWELEVMSVNDVPKFRDLDKDKIVTTQSGLMYEVLEVGEGESPKRTSTVNAYYTGWLTNGKVFDSAHARGEPMDFSLTRVIRGWTEGVQLMKPGGKFLFKIPSELAYGSKEMGSIPANSTLIFLIELVEVK